MQSIDSVGFGAVGGCVGFGGASWCVKGGRCMAVCLLRVSGYKPGLGCWGGFRYALYLEFYRGPTHLCAIRGGIQYGRKRSPSGLICAQN